MKFTSIALAITAATVGLSTPLAGKAQPKLEVYGTVDTYLELYNNGARSTARVSSGGLGATHFGIRGSEDLGRGLQAFFVLDSAVLSDSGMSADEANNGVKGALFSRMAVVGIAGHFGRVSLGRQPTPYLMTVNGECAADGALSSGAATFLVATTGINGSFNAQQLPGAVKNDIDERVGIVNNSVLYASPRVGGLRGLALVKLGESADSGSAGNVYNLGLHYQQGRLSARASYLQQESQNIQGNTERYYAVSASYDLGFIKPMATYVKRDSSLERNPNGGRSPFAPEVDVWQVGASAPVLGGKLLANVAALNNQRDADADALTYGARYDYPLSRRTTVYTGVQFMKNEARANYVIGASGLSSGPVPGAPGDDPHSVYLGVRHRF